jgi:hypothetical protein
VLARFGAKVADQTSVSPIVALKKADVSIDEGAQALKRRKCLVAKRLLDHLACAGEIKIKYFEAKGFFRSEVIGKRPLWHLRRSNYVADACAREAALMDDAKALGQYFFAVRRFTHRHNMYVRITRVKESWVQTAAFAASVGSTPWCLATVELRRPLGQKGGNPFLHISGSSHIRQPFGLKLHLLGE